MLVTRLSSMLASRKFTKIIRNNKYCDAKMTAFIRIRANMLVELKLLNIKRLDFGDFGYSAFTRNFTLRFQVSRSGQTFVEIG